MPHYLKSQTVDKLGFRSTLSYTTNGTISLIDGETIDATAYSGCIITLDANNFNSPDFTTFYLTNYSPGVILHLVVINKGAGAINLKPTSSTQINDLPLGDSIDLQIYGSHSTSLFIFDSTRAYSTGD